jgi:beta-galactosidase GanA
LSFSRVTLKAKGNVLTVVVDYHGHDETSTAHGVENPRGILGAALSSGTFSLWKIQGNAGGSANIDPMRGPMNEGGLYGERQGWHLPGFDTSKLPSTSTPMDGLTESGIQFYVTTLHLNIDSDLDAPLGIELSAPVGTVARVII